MLCVALALLLRFPGTFVINCTFKCRHKVRQGEHVVDHALICINLRVHLLQAHLPRGECVSHECSTLHFAVVYSFVSVSATICGLKWHHRACPQAEHVSPVPCIHLTVCICCTCIVPQGGSFCQGGCRHLRIEVTQQSMSASLSI